MLLVEFVAQSCLDGAKLEDICQQLPEDDCYDMPFMMTYRGYYNIR